jgi:hypothetical protein
MCRPGRHYFGNIVREHVVIGGVVRRTVPPRIRRGLPWHRDHSSQVWWFWFAELIGADTKAGRPPGRGRAGRLAHEGATAELSEQFHRDVSGTTLRNP